MTADLVIRCPKHPSYRGLSKLTRECDGCIYVRRMRGASVKLNVVAREIHEPVSIPVLVRWGSA